MYGDNSEVMLEFIFASAQRLYSLTNNGQLYAMIHDMQRNGTSWSIQKIRALFFLLLNVDMQLKVKHINAMIS